MKGNFVFRLDAGINTGWDNGSDWNDYIDYLEYTYGEASNKARIGFSVAGFVDFGISGLWYIVSIILIF